MHQGEVHRSHRAGWLRAAVLGANDGIVSTASLVLGVAAANADHGSVLTAGVAGLVAGAMSMAAGEYVSVFSQKDAEDADLAVERQELHDDPEFEHEELTQSFVERGVDLSTAERVAEQLMAHDALDAHAREELGILSRTAARPMQAALASAGTFAVGAALPLAALAALPIERAPLGVGLVSLVALAGLGAVGARVGGAPVARGALRVTLWGVAAMLLTTVVGQLFGAAF